MMGECCSGITSLFSFSLNTKCIKRFEILSLALNRLKDDDSMIAREPDNGQGVVILDKTTYLAKLDILLADKLIFRPVEESDNIKNLTQNV